MYSTTQKKMTSIKDLIFLFLSVLLFVRVSLSNDKRSPENLTCVIEIHRTELQQNVNVTLQVTRSWAPLGVDRFYTLVKDVKYFDNSGFFRVSYSTL